jgi:hypothetical protein
VALVDEVKVRVFLMKIIMGIFCLIFIVDSHSEQMKQDSNMQVLGILFDLVV